MNCALDKCRQRDCTGRHKPTYLSLKQDENIWQGHAFIWEKTKRLIKEWKHISGGRPFLLTGIRRVADANHAVKTGCNGIMSPIMQVAM